MFNTTNTSLPEWRLILRTNIRDINTLLSTVDLSDDDKDQIYVPENFHMNLPMRLAKKIQNGLKDPIARQFIPTKSELNDVDGFSEDPLQEKNCSKTPSLIHKYHGRVLLISSPSCAMHCRYCFRSHFDYTSGCNFINEINYIKNNSSINEVILSGGDPLSLNDNKLHSILSKITDIPHVKQVRIHTRFIVGIPERVSDDFISILSEINSKAQVWFIFHTNHERELDNDVINAVKKIHKTGIPVGTHSVLMKGVNDSTDELFRLFLRLIQNGIFPYYLNRLDKVKGASHFDVPLEKGLKMMQELQYLLPGYGIPKFVQEIPGEKSKVILGPSLHGMDWSNSKYC